MKLRNKKTGEIAEWDFGNWYQHILNPDNKESYECTLSEFIDRTAKFREEWEDYKEPKDIWWLDNEGNVNHSSGEVDDNFRKNREIGNYFLSQEEAELAVRKLKAWKRLKDKGFRFERWKFLDNRPGIWMQGNLVSGIVDELDTLFGGEE